MNNFVIDCNVQKMQSAMKVGRSVRKCEPVIDLTEDEDSDSGYAPKVNVAGALIQQQIRQRQSARLCELARKQVMAKLAAAKVEKSAAEKKKPRKKRGNGWSRKGSKKTRRESRENTSLFYVVAKGWRNGIFDCRKNAMKQLFGFKDPKFKTCKTLQEANDFMDEHREFPPALHSPFPPAPDTPQPPLKYVFPAFYRECQQVQQQPQVQPQASPSPPVQTAAPIPKLVPTLGIPEANAYYVPAAQTHDPESDAKFHAETLQLAYRIAGNPCNDILDPSECDSGTCPYSTGCISLQRFVLMRRVHQLNCVLLRNPRLQLRVRDYMHPSP